MKIVRFISEKGEELYGSHLGGTEVEVIEGDFFNNYRRTGRRETIRRQLAPIVPVNIMALGLNYRDHADEIGMAYPDIPVLFIKSTNSVIGPGETILLPSAGPERVDYEAELAVIIGKRAKNVPADKAREYIFGYTCANDVSARDWQIEKQKKQWCRGKSFDTFCPLGPWIVTADEISEPNNLAIRAILNGEVLQDSNTREMIFDIPTLISDLSRSLTLLPGTVILTGTPRGVGFTRKPPVLLKEGDVITIDIEGIGQLTNPVRKEE